MSEAPPPLVRRGLRGWEIWNSTAEDVWREVPLGKVVKCEIKQPRNLLRNSFYWKGATVAAENMDEFRTPKRLHIATKVALGEFEDVPPLVKGGRRGIEIGSTAFDKMPEHEFKKFLDAAFEMWADRLKCPVTDLMREAEAA